MKKSSCRTQTLASDGLCAVDYCLDCDVFYLRVGYATLQINPEVFSALSGILKDAVARYQHNIKVKETAGPAVDLKNPLH